MNFFKSSFFSDFKLPDVLALNQEDDPSSSQGSETLASSEAEEIALNDSKSSTDSQGEASVFSDREGNASSDAKGLADGRDEASASSHQEQTEGLWGLGGLMKSITLKSEGILQAYRKDLEDFGSGLKKETQIIAEVAAHAVKDLPTSLETGAFMAQESIESVGQAVEDFSSSVWRGTADLIAQGKEVVLRIDEDESFTSTAALSSSPSVSRYDNVSVPISGGKYSRFEAQVRAMQHDSSTYCDEPSDQVDYMAWKSTFSLPDKKHEIDSLVSENTFLQELLLRFVPDVVSEEIFWTRYFYRLHKLQQTEEARADLVKRANTLEEEDLSWDTEEELEEGGLGHDGEAKAVKSEVPQEVADQIVPAERVQADGSGMELEKDVATEGALSTQVSDPLGGKAPAKALAEEEEDLGWEVAEDVEESSSNDGKRSTNSEASWEVADVPREDMRKRFAAQEEDEDLSWDVDDGVDETK